MPGGGGGAGGSAGKKQRKTRRKKDKTRRRADGGNGGRHGHHGNSGTQTTGGKPTQKNTKKRHHRTSSSSSSSSSSSHTTAAPRSRPAAPSNWLALKSKLGPKSRTLMPTTKHGKRRPGGRKRRRNQDGSSSSSSSSAHGPEAPADAARYVACDAEMVGVGAADVSALARISLTDWSGRVLYDKFVQPRGRVTNYRTWVSGIRKQDLINAMPFARAQREVKQMLRGKILVGHALQNDLKALEMKHPEDMIRDTARYPPLLKRNAATGRRQPQKLKALCEQIGLTIQTSEHSSVEDAQASMRVFRAHKDGWDAWIASGGKFVPESAATAAAHVKPARPADPFASSRKKKQMMRERETSVRSKTSNTTNSGPAAKKRRRSR